MKNYFKILPLLLIVSCSIPVTIIPSANAMLLSEHNSLRSEKKIEPLTLNQTLVKVAEKYCKEIDKSGNFSHTGLDRSTPGVRVARENYFWKAVGENLGIGYVSADEAMVGWKNSSHHYENIINPKYTEVGFAHCSSEHYWVTVFAKPK